MTDEMNWTKSGRSPIRLREGIILPHYISLAPMHEEKLLLRVILISGWIAEK